MRYIGLKNHLKDLASEIRSTKQELKEYQRDHNGCCGGLTSTCKGMASHYRHLHIAYCLLRGTPYESIEKPREGNEPDMALVKAFQEQYAENVCPCPQGLGQSVS